MRSPRTRRRYAARLTALTVAALVLITGCTVGAGTGVGAPSTRSELPRDTIVNLFQWNWRSVGAECPRLAKVGYAGVQVSPAQEHAQVCLLYTSPSPRDRTRSRMPSSA